MIKHLNPISIFLFTAFILGGCSKESPKKNFVARVNDSYLTREDLSRLIDTDSVNNFYKNEVIRNWINKELLYQTALKKGILKEDEFNRLISDAKKELAASMLVKKYYDDEKVDYEPAEVEEFYNQHKDDFKRFYDSYMINAITFNDEDKAIKFRSTVLESDWEKALNVFKGDSSIIQNKSNELLYNYEIHPVTLFRVVSDLNPNEVSIVINTGPGLYTVVQEIQKFDQGSIPPYEAIKPVVESRFVAQKKEELLSNYIKELYSNNEIEVRN
ncbi:MAG: peptidylprolyl isomerase [Bacteroidetes bacterium]|nr:peptidylprolyl isomerase [Bacteroidota bacterium]